MRRSRQRVLRIRGGREPAYLFTAQAQFLPQPLDPPDPSGEPVVPQFRLETLWSVRLPRAHMRGLDATSRRAFSWARCEGLHGLSLRSSKAMATTVRSSVRMKSRTERVAQPSGGKAMRPNPSQEHATQLSEQIHLCRLRRFNIQDWCGWDRSCAGRLGWFGVAV